MRVSQINKEITFEEAKELAPKYDAAWQHPEIPVRQGEIVQREMKDLAVGKYSDPYRVLIEVWKRMPYSFTSLSHPNVLEVGGGNGYNAKVLRSAGFDFEFTTLDYSQHFKAVLFPGVQFRLGDARAIPFPDDSFDVVIHGCCLIHIFEYEKAIEEATRVTKKYIVLHRTPVQSQKPTQYFIKEGYGIPMLQLHFNEEELFNLFRKNHLNVLETIEVFRDPSGFAHKDYLLEKDPDGLMHFPV